MKTHLGIKAENYIKSGKLVPDDKMIKCMLEELKYIRGSVLLDGFPRTKIQAEKLWQVENIHLVINLIVPYETIIGTCH